MKLELDVNGKRLEWSLLFVGNNIYESEGRLLGRRSRLDAGELAIITSFRSGRLGAHSGGRAGGEVADRPRFHGTSRAAAHGSDAATDSIECVFRRGVEPDRHAAGLFDSAESAAGTAAMKRLIVHLSDLHFGRIDAATLDPIIESLREIRPDLGAVSGDLAQRARRVSSWSKRAIF